MRVSPTLRHVTRRAIRILGDVVLTLAALLYLVFCALSCFGVPPDDSCPYSECGQSPALPSSHPSPTPDPLDVGDPSLPDFYRDARKD